MRLQDHPKIALATLVGVFVLAFALSIYFSSAASVSATQPQTAQVTIFTNGNVQVVYVQYQDHCTMAYVSGLNVIHFSCFHND